MSGPFTDAELRDMQDASQERQPIPENRAPVNDGLPHHEFVPSEFAPDSGKCDQCGGGPLAPIHQKPVDQMARIADALERIADYLRPRADQVEQLTVQLAGCSSAASGATKDPAVRGQWGWSPAYQDVLDLRRKYDELVCHGWRSVGGGV